MNKKILFALPMSVLAIACAQLDTNRTSGCQTVGIPSCPGEAAPPVINLILAAGVTVAPPILCLEAGTEIEVKVVPPTSSTTVATVPKNPANWWMYGLNFPNSGGFTISVPEKLPSGDYDYLVVTGDGKCVDPRIHVN